MTTPVKLPAANYKAAGSLFVLGLIVLVTAICVFTPSILFFQQLTAYTLHIMLGFMALGFIAFLFRQERLMFISLGCCCILCLHLKNSANQQMRLAAVTANPSLKISHISLGNAENDYDQVINYLLQLDADFISFQELTPDWTSQLTNKLSNEYPYTTTMTRMDQYGMGFFSKIDFYGLDTVYFQQVPNLVAAIKLGDDHICNVISCQVIPPVNQTAFNIISKHFDFLTAYMKSLDGQMIVLGDLHLPPWSSEIQQFKVSGNLQDSRRDTNPRNIDGSLSLPRIPVDHIFYGDKFECTSFTELGNSHIGRIGISGMYQIHDRNEEMVH